MEIQSQHLDDLTTRLCAERRVWVRLALNRPQDDWQLSLLEVTLREPPPMWTRQSWLYERASFIAVAPAGVTVARWLERGHIRIKPASLPIAILPSVQAERRHSRFAGIFQPRSAARSSVSGGSTQPPRSSSPRSPSGRAGAARAAAPPADGGRGPSPPYA